MLARLASGARVVAVTAMAVAHLQAYASAVAASLTRATLYTAVAAIRCGIDRHAFIAFQVSIQTAALARSAGITASTAVLFGSEAYAGSAAIMQ